MSALQILVGPAIEWALTYAIHSTVLLGIATLVTYTWIRSDVWREIIWRGALVGSVLTAMAASVLPFAPLAGRVNVPGLETAAVPIASTAAGPRNTESTRPGRSEVAAHPEGPASPVETDASGDRDTTATSRVEAWVEPVFLAWMGTAAVLLVLLVRRNVAVFRHLRDRVAITSGPLLPMLAELRRSAGVWRPVTLSVSPSCSTPIVLGRSEICVPPRFLDTLDEQQQRAALAHELAHIRRQDPQWQLGSAVLNALLFFQPLNLTARLRLRESAEHLCDDWAVRQTGSGLALGRCLTEIAGWVSPGALPPLQATHAMAEGGSPLLERVRRIADGIEPVAELRLPPMFAVAVLLVAAVGLAPAVDGRASPVQTADRPGPEERRAIVALLEEQAIDDADPRLRRETAAELSDFEDPAAAAALMRIVRDAPDADVRAEAAQQLDEFPRDEVVGVLLQVVFADSAADVRMNALDVLDDFTLDSAREALRRLAREHPLAEVRGAAVRALSDDDGEEL